MIFLYFFFSQTNLCVSLHFLLYKIGMFTASYFTLSRLQQRIQRQVFAYSYELMFNLPTKAQNLIRQLLQDYADIIRPSPYASLARFLTIVKEMNHNWCYQKSHNRKRLNYTPIDLCEENQYHCDVCNWFKLRHYAEI